MGPVRTGDWGLGLGLDNKIHEEDRFYNWYHGYTKIELYTSYKDNGLNINIQTTATSGVVATQHYGEQFWPEVLERKLRCSVYSPPTQNWSLMFD